MKIIRPYYLTITLLSGIFSLFISGCAPKDNVLGQSTSSVTTDATVQPTSGISTPTNIITIQDLESMVSSEHYLADCKLKYPPVYTKQMGFLGIYPGITKRTQLTSQLGQAYRYSEINEQEEYFYSDPDITYAYSFLIIDNVVEDIAVVADAEVLSPLQSILEEYGCPDLIIAEALSDDPFDNSLTYNKTFFEYLNAGIRIRFESYPISYSDTPSVIGFQKPISLDSFLKTGFDLNRSKLASFSEAINSK